jgi:MazG family protein
LQKTAPPGEEKFRELLALIAKLRGPGGCPWDRSRTKEDIGRYLLDEAYEVLEALHEDASAAIAEELGDLLFQILFLARMGEEAGEFDIAAILSAITEKMIRRHPHVFAGAQCDSVEEVRENWARIKKEVEHKKERGGELTEGLPHTLPTLARTQRISARASAVGFDWENAEEVLKKVEEELAEFRAALRAGDRRAMQDEAGDLLFTLTNLCRFTEIDAESALQAALAKFIERFTRIERALASRGERPTDCSPAELDRLWNEAKQHEKQKGHPEKP